MGCRIQRPPAASRDRKVVISLCEKLPHAAPEGLSTAEARS